MKLIKESGVHAGDHQLTLNISDSHGQSSVQTLSLHVCDCDVSPNCKDPTTKMNVTTIAVVIISIPALLGKSRITCQAQPWVSQSEMLVGFTQILHSARCLCILLLEDAF